eukprot:SAG31_NODE_23897_length_493_cov_0.906091_1_plen_52_part_01
MNYILGKVIYTYRSLVEYYYSTQSLESCLIWSIVENRHPTATTRRSLMRGKL